MSERAGSANSIQAFSSDVLSLRLSTCLWFGYFYFTFYPGIRPMLDAGEV